MLYIILFPKMIAEPIVRFHEIASELTDRAAFDTVDQKLLITNVLGEQALASFELERQI